MTATRYMRHRLAWIAALGLAALPSPSFPEGPVPSAGCTTVGTPVAVQVGTGAPIVAGRDGQLAEFLLGDLSSEDDSALGDLPPPLLRCTPVRGVVGFSVDNAGSIFLANATSVSVISRNASVPKRSFSPALGLGRSITAIALLPTGEIELVLSGAEIAVYARASQGRGVAALRSFRDDKRLGPVSAITVDSQGRTYAYDDGGEIAVFAATARGAAVPLRLMGGAESGLRPAAPGAHGSRQLALDEIGNLYAIDDGSVVEFESASDAATPPDEGQSATATSIGGMQQGIERVAGVATAGYEGDVFVVSIGAGGKAMLVGLLNRFDSPSGRWVRDRHVSFPIP